MMIQKWALLKLIIAEEINMITLKAGFLGDKMVLANEPRAFALTYILSFLETFLRHCG